MVMRRAEEHIALFYPDTAEERGALLRAMQKKCGIQLAAEVEQCFVEHSAGLSGADIEAVLARIRMKSALRDSATIMAETFGRCWTISFHPLIDRNRAAESCGRA